MLINFKKENAGILNIPLQDKKSKNLTAERMAHITPRFISLVPGINDVSDDRWNRIKENERVVTYLKRGWLVLPYAETVPSKKEGVPDKDLTLKEYRDLPGKDQEVLIVDCEQIALLTKWKKYTKEAVMTVINDKIDRLEHPEKYQE